MTRGVSSWESGPARAPALPGVPSCPDGSCGSLLGSRAPCGECRDPTWFVVVSFLGCRRDLPHREGVRDALHKAKSLVLWTSSRSVSSGTVASGLRNLVGDPS